MRGGSCRTGIREPDVHPGRRAKSLQDLAKGSRLPSDFLLSLSSPLGLEGKDGLGPEYFLHVYHTLAWRAAKPSSWSGRASGLGPAGGFLFPATGQ